MSHERNLAIPLLPGIDRVLATDELLAAVALEAFPEVQHAQV